MNSRITLVATLAVLAGCGGLTGPSVDRTTVTPVDVPEVPQIQRPTAEIAPGVTASGVSDVGRLADAHRQSIQGLAYTWHYVAFSESTDATQPAPTFLSRKLRVEDERTYAYNTSRRRIRMLGRVRFLPDYRTFANGSVQHTTYLARNGNRTFRRDAVSNATTSFGSQTTSTIRSYLDLENATVVPVSVGGEPYYRINGTKNELAAVGPVREYSARALVTPSGFVRTLNVSYVDPSVDRRVRIRFEYAQVGTATVDRPDWVSDHLNESDSLNESGTLNGGDTLDETDTPTEELTTPSAAQTDSPVSTTMS